MQDKKSVIWQIILTALDYIQAFWLKSFDFFHFIFHHFILLKFRCERGSSYRPEHLPDHSSLQTHQPPQNQQVQFPQQVRTELICLFINISKTILEHFLLNII